MSTAVGRLIIVASMVGDKLIKKQMEDMGKKADTTSMSLRSMGLALGGIGFGMAISKLISYGDALTNAQNKMKLLTTSTGESAQYMQGLYQIAQDTRSDFGATVTIFQRVALALKDVGGTAGDAAQFTKTLGQAIQLSGATAQEANAAMIQLSQGLAKGKLNGDELRSVLEQLPLVGRLIAKEMGKDFGELRDLGAKGLITTSVVLNAIKNASQDIDKAFAQMTPTIGSAFTVLNNGLMMYFGNLMNSTGVSSVFASILITIGRNMEWFGSFLVGTILPGLMILAKMALPAVAAGFRALGVAIRANPLFTIATIIGYIISVLYMLSNTITMTIGGETKTIMEWFIIAWGILKQKVAELWTYAGPTLMQMGSAIYNAAMGVWPLVEAFGQLAWILIGGVINNFHILWAIAKPILTLMWQMFSGLVTLTAGLAANILDFGANLATWLTSTMEAVGDYCLDIINNLIEGMNILIGLLVDFQFGKVGGNSNGGKQAVTDAVQKALDASQALRDISFGVKDTTKKISELFGPMGDIRDAVDNGASDTVNELKETNTFMPKIYRAAGDLSMDVINAAADSASTISSATYATGNEMSNLLSAMQSTLKNISYSSAKTASATSNLAEDSESTRIVMPAKYMSEDQTREYEDIVETLMEKVRDEASSILLSQQLQNLVDTGQITDEKALAAYQEGSQILKDYYDGNTYAYEELMANGDQNFAALIDAIVKTGDKSLFNTAKAYNPEELAQWYWDKLSGAPVVDTWGEDSPLSTFMFNGVQYTDFEKTLENYSKLVEDIFDYTADHSAGFQDIFKLFEDTIIPPEVVDPIVDGLNENTWAIRQNTAQHAEMEKLYNKLNLARQNISTQYGGLDNGTLRGILPGFADGGSAYVPGGGAPDSVPFMAMLSPGERIEFTPRRKQTRSESDGQTVQIQVNLNGAGAVKEYKTSQAAVDRAIAMSVRRAQRAARV